MAKQWGFGRRKYSRRARTNGSRSWVGTLVDSTQPLSTFTASELVSVADYQRGNLQPKGLLETIYLELAVAPGTAQASAVNWAVFGIVVQNNDVAGANASNDPDNAGNLTDERWLWSKQMVVPASADGALTFSIHVKQRVKLADQKVLFVASNSDPAEAFDYSFHARCLIRV